MMSHKNYLSYLNFIESVRKKEKSIVFGRDYVVLSKEAYESMFVERFPDMKFTMYDEIAMHDWLKKRFLDE